MTFVSNFAFMARHDPRIADIGHRAEGYLAEDPNTALFKLRQLAEVLAWEVADRHRVHDIERDLFVLLKTLEDLGYIDAYPKGLFHELRRAGNAAVHELASQHKEALRQLRNARNLCIWFEGEFGDRDFKPQPFRPPPQRALQQLLAESEAERAAYRAQIEAQARRLSHPRVSFAQSFLHPWQGYPQALKDQLAPDLSAFREDPGPSALQSFGDITDEKFRWLPLGHDHCAVIAGSPHGDVYLVTWIGSFEDALQWVRHKRVEVHAVLGSLQVYEELPPPEPTALGLFASLTDTQLQSCGLPPPLVPAVRAVAHTDALMALCQFVPQEAADVLVAVASGQPFEVALREAGLRLPREAVDVDDFDRALAHQASRRAFAELDDPTFQRMLRAPIEQWRVFLHPSQQQIVRTEARGPVRVLGGAGTGKTVVLLHRVVHLLRVELPEPQDRVLVTTFTRTLAEELRRNLARLLTPDEMQRVTVTTLAQWAMSFVRAAGHRVQIVSDEQQKACWEAALAAQDPEGRQLAAFYREEWDLVVQTQGITEEADYLRASRQGRGTPLNRRERAQVWSVFQAYRQQLAAQGCLEWADLIRLARELQPRAFRSVLVDEIQDFGQAELRLIRALAPEGRADLFLVGDAHQRIYQLGTTLGACGIHIRGRSFRLKVNYRTTEEIARFAFRTLEGQTFDDLDGGADSLQGYRSLRTGRPPTVRLFATAEEELQAVALQVRAWTRQGVAPDAICVAARTGGRVSRYRQALIEAGFVVVGLDAHGESEGEGVRLSTLHRLKGTEFSRVLLASVQEDVFPMRHHASKHADEASVEDFLRQERCLMYVAATRARDELVIMGWGKPSPFVASDPPS
jgi:hypothetical protein